MSKAKTVVALALVSASVVGVMRWRGSADVADRGQRVVDRIWIDHMPKSETEKVNFFLAVTEDVAGQEIGIFQKASMWQSEHELFTYEVKGGKLVATFPQTGTTEELSAKATRCDKGDMDFCLQLDGNSRGAHQYYSRKGWEIEGAATPEQIEARLAQAEHDVTTTAK